MAHTVDPKTITNQQLLEGLWALGVPADKLKGVNTTGTQASFEINLQQNLGIPLSQITQARNLVAYRPDAGNVNDFLHTLVLEGATPQQLQQIVQGALQGQKTPGIRQLQQLDFEGIKGLQDFGAVKLDIGDLTNAASTVMGGQQITQAKIKTGQAQGITADQWNPFRGDIPAPPPQAPPGAPGSGTPGAPPAPAATPAATPPFTPAPVGAGKPTGAGGATTGTAAGGKADLTNIPAPINVAQAEQVLKQKYGYMGALLDDPDIHRLMLDVAGGTLDPNQFQDALMNTDWWRNHNDNQHAWATQEATNPGQGVAQIAQQASYLKSTALSFGLNLSDDEANEIAKTGLSSGWNDSQFRSALSSHYIYKTGQTPLTGVTSQIKGVAANFLIPMDDQSMTKWAQGLIAGTSSMDDVTDYARQMAASMHPGIGAWLNADPTRDVKQFLSPYAAQAANVLEKPADQIDFTDPKFANVFGKMDPKTGEQSILSGPEWQSYLRTLPEWQYTDNAHQAMSGLTSQLFKDLGVRQ